MRQPRVRTSWWTRRGWRGVFLAVVTLLAACGQPSRPATPSPTMGAPTSTVSARPTPAVNPALKSIIHGLVDRTGPPPSTFVGTVTNFVVDAPWGELQPTPEGPLAPDNVIDQAITTAESLNSGAGEGKVAVKVRLMAGIDAPDWAKQLGGGPVSITDPQSGTTGTVGFFWTAAYEQAYSDLWTKLATAYDNVPVIHEITVAECMTITDEPFLRDVADPTNVQNLQAAGYTLDADEACQEQEIQLGSLWHHTLIGVAFNPYQAILAGGSTASDEGFTEQMMDYCRAQLGSQCVLENNSIRSPLSSLGAAYQSMYVAMQQLGAPISFQTATIAKVGDLQATIEWAASVGADAVELPEGYAEDAPSSFQSSAALLQGNPA